MIEIATLGTAKSSGEALAEQFKFRHRHFVVGEGWELPSYNGMEYDQFDTPAAVYLVWRDESGVVRGMIRLLPTTLPFMLGTLWRPMLPPEGNTSKLTTWEITRFGIERHLPLRTRKMISAELILACIEFAVERGIDTFLFLTSWPLLKKIIPAAGVNACIYKRATLPSGHDVASAAVAISHDLLNDVRFKVGIATSVMDG